jgi:hypothetical protein
MSALAAMGGSLSDFFFEGSGDSGLLSTTIEPGRSAGPSMTCNVKGVADAADGPATVARHAADTAAPAALICSHCSVVGE